MKVRGQVVHSIAERLERLSVPEPNSGCWLWLGATSGNAGGIEYGRLVTGSRGDGTRRTQSAHRVSYECHCGSIPVGMEVCHRCDVGLCINPDHLFLGTRQDNIDDRERKGRNVVPLGAAHGNAKLTDEAVNEIRLRLISRRLLANKFGVSPATIKDIQRGRAWKHLLPSPPPQPTKQETAMAEPTERDRAFLARHRALADHGTASGRSDVIDIAAEKRGESEKAFRLFDGKRTEWVPKSQVEDNGDGTFAMPEWLAKEKGFI